MARVLSPSAVTRGIDLEEGMIERVRACWSLPAAACWRSAGPAWPGHVLGAAAVTARAAVVSTVSRAGSSTLLRAAAHAGAGPATCG
jgi:hypothetical protein